MIKASGRLDLPFTCAVNGVPTAPTGTPTGVLVKNGTDLGTTVTVTMSTAQGIASCTIPSDAADGNRFYLRISAVVDGETYEVSGPVETIVNSVSQTGDSYARIGAAGAGLTAIGDERLSNLDATVSSRLDASGVRTAVGLASANMDTQLETITERTDNLPDSPAAVGDAMSLTGDYDAAKSAASQASVDSLFTTAMTESYASDGAAPTPAQALFLIQQSINEAAISGTTKTVKKIDGSTTAATYTLDSATAPTSITRAT